MNKTLLSLLVASSSFLSIDAYATTNIESDWWIKWSDIKKQDLINENQTCGTLKTKASLTEKQHEIISKKCTDVVFYDSFNSEEGNGYAPLMGYNSKIHYGMNYGSLIKWDVLGAPVRLFKHYNGHAQTNNSGDDEGYVLSLRSNALYGAAGKIEMKGPLKLMPGTYRISYKLKPTSGHGSLRYSGVVTTIQGQGLFDKDKSYSSCTYTRTSSTCNTWLTVNKKFTVTEQSNVYITMEDMFNGTDHYGSMIDDIIIFKTNDDGPSGALTE
ncbi:hypothetical protein [Photobacterium damselae]|uniref:hypothetical protein n=1 Tax=Photobacterium damselae TaxID=38293 RepID=UPI001EE097DB|nr:hypothetical protein [Photobacterium damselae]MCG3825944.1 hypothetical protein [Photobacterium damselae]